MFKNITIGTKITAVVITIVLITVATISYFTYNLSKKSIERRQDDNLNVLANTRVDKINAYITQINKNAHLITSSELVKNGVINKESSPSSSEDDSMGMDSFGGDDPFADASGGDMEEDPFAMDAFGTDDSGGGSGAMDFFLASSTEDDLRIYINDVNNAFSYEEMLKKVPHSLLLPNNLLVSQIARWFIAVLSEKMVIFMF